MMRQLQTNAGVTYRRNSKPASESPWTRDLWIYDLRTNRHFTLKANPLTRVDLDDFVACYNPVNRLKREESEPFRRFTYDELVNRDKANLDIFWLRDESMKDTASPHHRTSSPTRSLRTSWRHWSLWRKSRRIWGRRQNCTRLNGVLGQHPNHTLHDTKIPTTSYQFQDFSGSPCGGHTTETFLRHTWCQRPN